MKQLVGGIVIGVGITCGLIWAFHTRPPTVVSDGTSTTRTAGNAVAPAAPPGQAELLKEALQRDYVGTSLRLPKESPLSAEAAATLVAFVRKSDVDGWPAMVALGRIGEPSAETLRYFEDAFKSGTNFVDAAVGVALMGDKGRGLTKPLVQAIQASPTADIKQNAFYAAVALLSVSPGNPSAEQAVHLLVQGDGRLPSDVMLPDAIAESLSGNRTELEPDYWRAKAISDCVKRVVADPRLRPLLSIALLHELDTEAAYVAKSSESPDAQAKREMAEALQKRESEQAAEKKKRAAEHRSADPYWRDYERDNDNLTLPYVKNRKGQLVPAFAYGGPSLTEVERSFELQREARNRKESAHLASGKRMRVAIASLIRQELLGQQSEEEQNHLRALDRLSPEAKTKVLRDLVKDPIVVDQNLNWQFCPDVELAAMYFLSSPSDSTNAYLTQVLVNPIYHEQAQGYAASALGHFKTGGREALANLAKLSNSAKTPAVKSLAIWAQRQMKP